MLTLFKCKHPFNRLAVEKKSTSQGSDDDFEYTTHHLYCNKCGAKLDLKFATLIGGVDAFIKRNLLC